MPRDNPGPNKKPTIAIIGAGFAGLCCADVLLQHNYTVTIFEARNRLGGRVAQSNHLGHVVDLGANWIHGSQENPILRIAKETGTELHAWDEREAVFGTGGTLLDAEEAEEYSRLLWDDGLIARAFEYSEQHTASIDPKRSLYDFFEERSRSLFTDLAEDVAKRKRQTLLQFTRMWGAYVGSPVQRQSLKFFWLEKTIEGENPFVAGTYSKILEAVATPAREGADVRLGCRVNKVVNGVGGGNVTVKTVEGGSEEFDEVVVTVPLGYLKRNLSMFDPPLPARLTSAINDLGYGNLDKVYITFPSAFWDRPLPHSKTVSQPLDPDGKTPNVAATTIPLHQPPGDKQDIVQQHFPGFAQWLPPSYTPNSNPEHWDQQAMNLAALPPASTHPTLLFYIYGPCATAIASIIGSSPRSPAQDAVLIDFFRPYFSLLPNYSSSNPACTPTGILTTAWTNDELAGYGSYSNFQVGLERGSEDIEVIREGCPERHLRFAGEHTAPFDALGTTTGAYLSGERAAGTILEAYERKRNGWG